MLARTRGPSMKPAWAATTSSIASDKSVSTTKVPPEGQPGGKSLGEHRIHGFPWDRRHSPQQVAEKEARGGEGERGPHVHHGALSGLDLGLPHDRQPVRDRLDAGVGTASERVGPHEQQQQSAKPE